MWIKNRINPLFFENSPKRESPTSSQLTNLPTWSGQLLPLHATTHAPSFYSPLLLQEQAIFPWTCQHCSIPEPREQLSLKTLLSPSSHKTTEHTWCLKKCRCWPQAEDLLYRGLRAFCRRSRLSPLTPPGLSRWTSSSCLSSPGLELLICQQMVKASAPERNLTRLCFTVLLTQPKISCKTEIPLRE